MEWTKDRISEVVEKQRKFFRGGKTLDVDFRIRQLKRLREGVLRYSKEFEKALYEDLGRSENEAYLCDIGTVVMEINEILSGIKSWSKPETHFSGLACFPSIITKVYKMPYGVSLIISPFNFPILLSLGVLAASISAGNTAVIKVSSKSVNCSSALKKMINEIFPEKYVAVIDGGHDVADFCLEQRFDKIFYTGSPKVGVHVMEMAAKNLTPVALELGGETGNWCIVRKDADLKDAARKIAFFKLCNSGQICININQVAVAREVADEFIKELKNQFVSQIGMSPLENEEYPRLIDKRAYEKCMNEAKDNQDKIIFGGHGDDISLKFEPTILYPVDINDPIVNHELFNPLLPIVPFDDKNINKVLDIIESREHGLAMYIFTRDKKWAMKVMSSGQYGGGCINEVCLHLMVKGVPFNGVGHSGMGAYHGIWGFREFSHPSTVLIGSRFFNLSLREHPYNGWKNSWKKILTKGFEK